VTLWITPLLLIAALLMFAIAYARLVKTYPLKTDALVDTVDLLLPQTQCAQCGYPGCRPYAEAVVHQHAALNLCPPGGQQVHIALTELIGETEPTLAPQPSGAMVAYINENECIGCTLCLPPCPVDAIVGASNLMHTVVKDQCTGCELCIPACPVDCITLLPAPERAINTRHKKPRLTAKKTLSTNNQRSTERPTTVSHGCINCGQCNPVCPVNLSAQELFQALNTSQRHVATNHLGLMNCIECGLCDRACPSQIPLAHIFAEAKDIEATLELEDKAKQHYKNRYHAHLARIAREEQTSLSKREQRLKNAGRWS